MSRPFEGIRILDVTHVLAGPYATYQLAVFGADVLKIEFPDQQDQSRNGGGDRALDRIGMGTLYLTQASNKSSMTLNLKSEKGRGILKRLATTADILVENYRPGSFDRLGLGYDDLSALNPRLIYCSISAFGSAGPRAGQTAYDHVIQASSGLMAMTGTEDVNPIKIGTSVVDYSTGMTGAFALAAALFQRERTGKGQRIDLAMFDVALTLAGAEVTRYLRTGKEGTPKGNTHRLAASSCYETADGLLMMGASNLRQQRRLWEAVGRPDMIKHNNADAEDDKACESEVLGTILRGRSAREWEDFFQARHVPAARVRTLAEALADDQLASRGLIHTHRDVASVPGEFSVPVSAVKFAHGAARVDSPPPVQGDHTEFVLSELGFGEREIAQLRDERVI